MRSFAMLMLGLVLGGVLGATGLLWGLSAVGYVNVSVSTKGNECPCPGICPCPTLPAKVPAVVPEKPVGEEKPVGDVGATE